MQLYTTYFWTNLKHTEHDEWNDDDDNYDIAADILEYNTDPRKIIFKKVQWIAAMQASNSIERIKTLNVQLKYC